MSVSVNFNFNQPYFTYKYPSEQLVTHLSVLSKQLENKETMKALDFGFGAGRHIRLLKDFGFNVYGLDITPDAKDTMKHYFGEVVPDENIVIDDIFSNKTVFEKDSFDLVIGFASVYNRPYAKMIELLDALMPMIKPGGYFLANFRTKHDDSYLQAEEMIDDFTPVMPETAGRFSFLDSHDLKRLMNRYSMEIQLLERYERVIDGSRRRLSYWMCTARKKETCEGACGTGSAK